MFDISERTFVVCMKALGYPNNYIEFITGRKRRTIDDIYARAIKKGFDPNIRPFVLKDEYFRDAPRSGRPRRTATEGVNRFLAEVSTEPRNRGKVVELISAFKPGTLLGSGDVCLDDPSNNQSQETQVNGETRNEGAEG